MNQKATALFKQLTWQQRAEAVVLHNVQQQKIDIDKKIDFIQQKVLNSCTMTTLIVPEQEIIRSHFLRLQQQHMDELLSQKTHATRTHDALLIAQQKRKTTLKMLEKYITTQQKQASRQMIHAMQISIDEWMIQRHHTIQQTDTL